MHPALLNGHPHCTLIESFYGKVSIVRPGFRQEFETIKDAQTFIAENKWEISVEIIKGSPVIRSL